VLVGHLRPLDRARDLQRRLARLDLAAPVDPFHSL
jgi:hypothetical protein